MAGSQYFYPSGQQRFMRTADHQLPPGWEMLWDRGSGWPYFVDHNTQSTTWQDPRMGSFSGGFGQQVPVSGMRWYPSHDFNKGAVEIPIQHETTGPARGPVSHHPAPPSQQQQMPEQPAPAPQHAAPPFHLHSQKEAFLPQHAAQHGHPWAMHHNHPPQAVPESQHQQPGNEGAREIPIHHISTCNFPVNQPQPQRPHSGFHSASVPQAQEQRQQQESKHDRGSPGPRSAQHTVYTIPVQHEAARAPSPRAASPRAASPKKQYSAPPQPATQRQTPPQQRTPPPQPQEEVRPEPPKQKTVEERAFEIIDGVMNDVKALDESVNNFRGTKAERDYKYLEEMLTRNLLKLDSVEADGHDNIRQARRNAVRMIEAALDLLELKACANEQKLSAESASANTEGPVEMNNREDANISNQAESRSASVPMDADNSQMSDMQSEDGQPQTSDSSKDQNQSKQQKREKNPSHVKEMVLDSEVSC